MGYIMFCIMYFLIQNMAFVSMWFAHMAQVNVGVITVIWSVHPLFVATADFFIFGQTLKYFHFVGMFVMFSIATPFVFTLNSILVRKLTSADYGLNFNATDMAMSGYFFVNLLILIVSICFWQSHQFDMQLFVIGTIGSIINTIGISLNTTALSKGPLGPVSAIAACSNILLVVEEAIRNLTVPNWVEFLALILGLIGVLEIVYPEMFEKLFRCTFGSR